MVFLFRTCVPVNQTRPVCSLLPYDYTTDGANYTAHNDIMPFYFDPDAKRCHADWFFFLCAYIMPECRPDPPQDWKPLCVCAGKFIICRLYYRPKLHVAQYHFTPRLICFEGINLIIQFNRETHWVFFCKLMVPFHT